MWSRQFTGKMGINQEDFVKAFVLALSDDQVIHKLENTITGRLVQEVNELRDTIKDRDIKINNLEKEVGNLNEALDHQEQYTRRNNLRVTGIPEKDNEDIVKVTLDFVNSRVCVTQPVVEEDIDRVHRMGRKQGSESSRPIMIRFSSYRIRHRVYTNRVRLNPKRRLGVPGNPWGLAGAGVVPENGKTTRNNAEATPSSDGDETVTENGPETTGTEGGHIQRPNTPIVFINEDLTKLKAKLLWLARQAKRGKKINDCWSSDGNIIVKDKNNTIKQIRNEIELSSLLRN